SVAAQAPQTHPARSAPRSARTLAARPHPPPIRTARGQTQGARYAGADGPFGVVSSSTARGYVRGTFQPRSPLSGRQGYRSHSACTISFILQKTLPAKSLQDEEVQHAGRVSSW